MNTQDPDQIVRQFEGLCRSVVGKYFPPRGLDRDDLLQEARIGIATGLRDYKASPGVPLRAFLYLAAERRVITAIKAATRHKHAPLNDAITTAVGPDGAEVSIFEVIPDRNCEQPGSALEVADEAMSIEVAVERAGLSRIEAKCLAEVLEGGTYADVAVKLGVTEKTVDNALWRVKRKLARAGEAMAA